MGGTSHFLQIYRRCEVGQSYITSVAQPDCFNSCAVANDHDQTSSDSMQWTRTCIPLCVIAFLFKVIGIRWSFVFYVESIARVRMLSLNGLLLYSQEYNNKPKSISKPKSTTVQRCSSPLVNLARVSG